MWTPLGRPRPRFVTLLVVAAALLPFTSAAQRPTEAEDASAELVVEGRRALTKGDLGDAARALDQAIALNPRRIEAYVLRATVHLSRAQYPAGIALLRRARALAPDSEDVLTKLGTMLLLDGKPDEGVPILEDVSRRFPRQYEAHAALGRHYAAVARWREAIPALEAYLATRPKTLASADPLYRVDLAEAYLRERQPAQARVRFAAVLAERPRDLRARLGLVWATAAVDCRQARALLDDLSDLRERHPEIWLVDGECALAMGDTARALRASRRYADTSAPPAAGHALAGAAYAARGDLAAARRELGKARALEPGQRRWVVRQAQVLRRAGEARAAIAGLEAIGPPERAADEPTWWRELGEALLAAGEAGLVIERIAPIVPQLPKDAQIHALVAEALLARDNPAGAIPWLEAAEAIQSTSRARGLLARALASLAGERLDAGATADAEPLLARAAAAESSPARWRDLGAVRLALRRPHDAMAALQRATQARPDAISSMLLGRARAATGDTAGARASYADAAARATGADAVAVAIDTASFELIAGEPAAAVAALERVQAAARAAAPELGAHYRRALTTARHASALIALHDGATARALSELEAAATTSTGADTQAIQCDLALATLAGGDLEAAARRLQRVAAAPCPFAAPADTQAVPILLAFTDGMRPRRAARALQRLAVLEQQASGPARTLAATAIRVVALHAADQAYRAGRLAEARRYLAQARRIDGATPSDEVVHNLAVLDVAEGRLTVAIAALERIAPRRPEALVNLGVAWDRAGQAAKALDAWRRARRTGFRFAPLAEWITAKEQIWGRGEESP